MMFKKQNRHLSSSQIILFGFLAIVFCGTLLLMLPPSSRAPGGASALDALFTATSAVCVTGLVVHDTATYWSPLGQGIILALIQIGGMGVVTVAVSLARFSGRKIGLMQRSTMQEAIAAPHLGGVVRLTGFILKVTFILELSGALLLLPVFWREFGFGKGVWYAIFHSVSAFCNAGFDLMGARTPYSSLSSFVGEPIVNIVVMLLIVIGGIGFLTWDDIARNRLHFHRYRLQSKAILTVTGLLLLFAALYFYFCEFSGESWSWMNRSERVYAALFQAVTPRTAGFNTVDFAAMSGSGQVVTILLMLIGGSPGSTAGGIKTTTLAVVIASAAAAFKREEDAHLFGRRIAGEAIRHAAAILLMYLTLFLGGALLISGLDGVAVGAALFETASAIGTVGLTLGITAELGSGSRLVLIGLMFFGRVGGLTLVFAAVSGRRSGLSRLPQEKITVG